MQTQLAPAQPMATLTALPGEELAAIDQSVDETLHPTWERVSDIIDAVLFYGILALGVSFPVLGALYAWWLR